MGKTVSKLVGRCMGTGDTGSDKYGVASSSDPVDERPQVFGAVHRDIAWRVASAPRAAGCTYSCDEAGVVARFDWKSGRSTRMAGGGGDGGDDESPVTCLATLTDARPRHQRRRQRPRASSSAADLSSSSNSSNSSSSSLSSSSDQAADDAGSAAVMLENAGAQATDWLACGSRNGTVRIWTPAAADASASSPRTFAAHKKAVSALCFVDGGARLLSGSRDYSLSLWDVAGAAAAPLATETIARNVVTCLARVPGTSTVFQGSEDLSYRLWDLRGGAITLAASLAAGSSAQLPSHFPLCCDSAQNTLVTGHNGFDGTGCSLLLWDLRSLGAGPIAARHGAHEQAVTGVALLGGRGREAVTVSRDGTLGTWDVAGGTIERTGSLEVNHLGQLTSVAPDTHDAAHVYITTMSGTVARVRLGAAGPTVVATTEG
jgi:WD40 repeat protein